ncbi:MAG: GNAT family N-acetyltransferase, partial [Bacteroidota bacterium]
HDIEGIYRLGSNPKVMQYITGRTQTRKEAKADLARRMKTARLPLGYWIVETMDTQDFVGWMALKQLDQTKDIEIGYRFVEEQWGRGFATEASLRVLKYGFEVVGLERIVAVALAVNSRSLRVMEKIGLKYEKKGRYYGYDCVFYALSKLDYEKESTSSTI